MLEDRKEKHRAKPGENGQMKNKKHQNTTHYDVAVIGAGPAGMTAAICLSRAGYSVILCEKNDKPGRKILSTGNGRCNLTNLSQKKEDYRSNDSDKAWKLISQYPCDVLTEFFCSIGLMTKDRNGYVYPFNEQAQAVREAFDAAIREEGITLGGEVKSVAVKDVFHIVMDDRTVRAGRTVVATGGLAAPKLGSTGDGYEIAKRMGHHIISPLPALTSLISSAPFLKKASGVRNEAAITLIIDGEPAAREQGELQWTDYGISGVAVFQLSRFAVVALEEKKSVSVILDLVPKIEEEKLKELILHFCRQRGRRTILQLLSGIMPIRLCPIVLREAGLCGEEPAEALSVIQISELCRVMKEFPLRIKGYQSFEKAQTTRGGVPLDELSDHLESVYVPGLYFVGEVSDVDGTCGGYNLHWAFASGMAAAHDIIDKYHRY